MNRDLSKEPVASTQDELSPLAHQLSVMWRYKWQMLLATTVALGAMLVVVSKQTPVYQASANLIIASKTPKVLNNVADLDLPTDSERYYHTQIHVLSSRPVLEGVIERGHLLVDKDLLAQAEIDASAGAEQKRDLLIEHLQRQLTVAPMKDSQIVSVKLRDTDSKRAAMLANLLTDVYVEQNLETKQEATRSAATWLDTQLVDLGNKVRTSELAINDFKRENNVLAMSLEERQNLLSGELEAVSKAFAEARLKRMAIAADLATAEKSKTQPELALTLPAVRSSPEMQSMMTRIAQLDIELEKLSQRYGESHPLRLQAKTEKQALEKQLDKGIERIVRNVESDAATAARVEHDLSARINELKAEALGVGRKGIEYNRLQREYETNKNLHAMVLTRLKEASLSGQLETNNVRILERAETPKHPVSPNVPRQMGLALLFGLVLGWAVSLALNHLDDTVRSQQDLEQSFGLTFLGIVPAAEPSKDAPKMPVEWLVQSSPRSLVAEHVRSIRSNLVFMSPDAPLKSFSITSAEAGAGKSALTVCFGLLMSQTQGKTLLVDSDLRRPRLHKALGVSHEKGLSGVIMQEHSIEDGIKRTEIPDLDIMPAGMLPPNPVELLHSNRFADLVEELQRRYKLVIFDSPPLLGMTDALVIGKRVNGVVLVARWEQTARAALRRSVEQLADVRVKVLGTVLNGVDLKRRAYYGYKYSSYLQYETAPRK